MADIVTRVCDIDGTPDAERLTFAVENMTMEIDLGTDAQKRLAEVLAPYVKAGRRRGNGRMPGWILESLGEDELPPVLPALPSQRVEARQPYANQDKHTRAELDRVRSFAAQYSIKVGTGKISQDIWDACEHDDLTMLKPGRLGT